MKTIFAVQKSDYSHCLMKYIRGCDEITRENAYNRMMQIEKEVKSKGDEIQIVITTKNTPYKGTAPAMTEENIEKNKHL